MEVSYEENISRMDKAFRQIKSGEVLIASKDVTLGGVQVKTNDFIGVYRGEIQCSFASASETLPALVKHMFEPSDEIITLFFGEAIKKSDAETMHSILQKHFPDKTVELYFGGQSHSYYIVSVE